MSRVVGKVFIEGVELVPLKIGERQDLEESQSVGISVTC
jgi:hypothetical protein